MKVQDKFDNPNPDLVQKYRDKFLDPKSKKELEAALGWLFLTDNIKRKTRESIQNSMRNNDRITLILAIIGIIGNVIASSIYITFHTKLSKITI
jgi:hypothetical protein